MRASRVAALSSTSHSALRPACGAMRPGLVPAQPSVSLSCSSVQPTLMRVVVLCPLSDLVRSMFDYASSLATPINVNVSASPSVSASLRDSLSAFPSAFGPPFRPPLVLPLRLLFPFCLFPPTLCSALIVQDALSEIAFSLFFLPSLSIIIIIFITPISGE